MYRGNAGYHKRYDHYISKRLPVCSVAAWQAGNGLCWSTAGAGLTFGTVAANTSGQHSQNPDRRGLPHLRQDECRHESQRRPMQAR